MNKALSFKILSVFTIRFLFVLVITTSNFKFDVLPLINDWKVYLLFIILWFLFEIFFNQNLQNHYLFIFFGIGFLKILLILYTKNFDLNIFYGAPDSIPLKELGGTLLECFQYSRNCGGEPHFQRGPSYSILISIFTLGTKISPIFLIIIQIFLYAFINTGIIKKINSKNSIVNSSIMILLAVYPSLSIFSRIVLYEIWGVFCLFIAWYISNENKDSKRNYYYYLLLISFSVYLQIQFFIAIFLFFLKFCYFNKVSLKKILIGFLIPVLLIFAWGFRNATHLGHWDFNPYSGCYLEKNIIEPTEAIKNNVSNEEIRAELINSHIFAYPNIWPESSCLAAIEAMSAKNLLVLPNLAALKETGSKSKFLYDFTNNASEHINTFQKQLTLAIQFVQKQSGDYKSHLDELKIYADNNHNLNEYLKKWEQVISNK